MKKLEELAKQDTFSRHDLLTILDKMELKVSVESFARVLDLKEELGFNRYEEAQ